RDKLTIDVGYKNINDRYLYNPGSVANQNKSNLFQALIKDEFKLNEKTSFTAGTQFINKQIKSNDRGNHGLNQSSGFLVLHQRLGENFSVSPAIRAEWNEISGFE